MSMSERQKLLRLQEHAREEDEKILDVFNCVERLHDADLRKAIVTEKGEWVLTKIPRGSCPPGKASFQRLARALPRHIMACLLARQPACPPDADTASLTDCQITSTSCFNHVAKALQLLCNLCDSAAQNRTLRAEVLLSQGFVGEVVDAVNLVMLAMAGPEAQRCLDAAQAQGTMQGALDRASMVPGALRALAYAFTACAAEPSPGDPRLNWDSITDTLLQHPRGAVLLDAAFDAVRTLVLAVRAVLTTSQAGSEDVYKLAFHAGAAMELLSYLCTTPVFYHRLMIHDPSGAAPLRLVLTCLTLHDAPLAAPPYSRLPPAPQDPGAGGPPLPGAGERPAAAATAPPGAAAPVGLLASFSLAQAPYSTGKGKGAAELLAARGCALLVMLAEFEEPSYMDQLFEHQEATLLARQLQERAATFIAQVLLRPSLSQHPAAAGEPQMCINVLRAAELLCDDSNFKAGLAQRLAREVAQLLCMDPLTFKSRWCAGEEAVAYLAKDEILVNSISNYAMEGVERLEKACRKLFSGSGKHARGARVGQQLALERAVLLFKMIGNLHCPSKEAAGATDAFAMRLLALLRPNPAALSLALHNLRQLQQLVLPFGPPHASEDVELVAEVDLSLFVDLLAQLERGRVPLQQPAQLPAMLPRQVVPLVRPPLPAAGATSVAPVLAAPAAATAPGLAGLAGMAAIQTQDVRPVQMTSIPALGAAPLPAQVLRPAQMPPIPPSAGAAPMQTGP